MIGPSWNARFVAKVLGVPAAMVASILAYPWLISVVGVASMPMWLKGITILVYVVLIFGAVAWRLVRGGEQGPTDISIIETPGSRAIYITNVPLAHVPSELPRAMTAFQGLFPMPRPVGRVTGNPADE